MRKFVYILLIIIVLVSSLVLTKNAILMFLIKREVKIVTGVHLGMGNLKVGLTDATVSIKDFKIYNPPEYPDKVMLDMPEIYIDVDLKDALKGKIHIQKLKLDVAEFMVVRNRAGELNLNSLKVVKEEKNAPSEDAKVLDDIQIDLFQLKIDKVVFKDYSKGVEPDIKVFNIHINQKFENITDPDVLVKLIVVKALRDTQIAKLAHFDLRAWQAQVSGILTPAKDVVNRAGNRAANTIAGAAGTLDQAVVGLEGVFFHPEPKVEDEKSAKESANER